MKQGGVAYKNDDDLKLRLGMPGTEGSQEAASSVVLRSNKRPLNEDDGSSEGRTEEGDRGEAAPSPKAQIVGWPPIRSYRKNNLQSKKSEAAEASGIYVKVSTDGAPFLRKIDLKGYEGYPELLKALEAMFKLTIGQYSEREGYKGSEYAPTYEDKDGDLMLVGDVPWSMFTSSCKKLRIIRGSEARGLGCGV